MKPNEVVDLNWKQVDLEQRKVTFLKTESSQERVLEISIEPPLILEKRKKNVGPVFITYYREPFTRPKLARMVNEFKIRGTFKKKWTPMDLRHSFAVNYLMSGGDIRQLQYLLGHWNVHDTKKLYAEVLTKRAASTAQSPFEIGSLNNSPTL